MKTVMSQQQAAARHSERPLILIVDDEEPIVQALAMFFEDLDYGVCTFTNPRRALEHLSTCRPDLIITDLMMPGMNGGEFIRRVREEQHLNLPIIVMSAARTPAQAAHADAYLSKPFDLTALEQLIARFLPRRFVSHSDKQDMTLFA